MSLSFFFALALIGIRIKLGYARYPSYLVPLRVSIRGKGRKSIIKMSQKCHMPKKEENARHLPSHIRYMLRVCSKALRLILQLSLPPLYRHCRRVSPSPFDVVVSSLNNTQPHRSSSHVSYTASSS